ncbi:MAG: hypothetical protein ACRD3M_02535 [Thermoanaerobaculia bacterium]
MAPTVPAAQPEDLPFLERMFVEATLRVPNRIRQSLSALLGRAGTPELLRGLGARRGHRLDRHGPTDRWD